MKGDELDSEDIITGDYMSIDENTKVTQIWNWMHNRIPELMINAIDQFVIDSDYVLDHQSKVPDDSLRCYPRRPEDGRIDWKKPVISILRLINASNKPYAGAFCKFEKEKIIIWDAELVSTPEVFLAIPGQVTLIGEGFVEVACGNGKLRITEIEVDGKSYPPNHHIKSIRQRLT